MTIRRFTLEFNVDNAAFEETLDGEYRKIFAKIADQIADGETSRGVWDSNGNLIGEWEIAELK